MLLSMINELILDQKCEVHLALSRNRILRAQRGW